jgi:hypothetical protein
MRWLPMVSITEVKGTLPEADPHWHPKKGPEHAPAGSGGAIDGDLVPEGAE